MLIGFVNSPDYVYESTARTGEMNMDRGVVNLYKFTTITCIRHFLFGRRR